MAKLSSSTNARLEGKVALISGGAKGVGESIARVFVKHGAKVIIADILDKLGQSVCDNIGLDQASFVHCDVSIESNVEDAINFTISKHGKLDIMINNAATIDEPKPSILDNSMSAFERVIKVNLTGVFLGTKHAARVMIPRCNGTIITIGSVSSSVGGVATHAYTSSKHAVIGLTKNVAAELGIYKIRVNCVSPYFVANPAGKKFFKMDDKAASEIYSNIQGETLQIQDIAEATLFLASDESRYISGHNLALDGGFTVINPAFGLYARL